MLENRMISCISVIILMLICSSCSSVNIEEVQTSADQFFRDNKYVEFNSQYNILLKENPDQASIYLDKIKGYEIFNTTSLKTQDELLKAKESFRLIGSSIGDLKDFTDQKEEEVLILIEENIYQFEVNSILDQILSRQLEELESPLSKIYKLSSMLDSIETINEVIREYDSYISDTNGLLIELENLKVPNDDKSRLENFVTAFELYKSALNEKVNYLKENRVNIVTYNELFMKGNIFAVEKSVELNGQLDKLTGNIKSSADSLKQRITSLKNNNPKSTTSR